MKKFFLTVLAAAALAVSCGKAPSDPVPPGGEAYDGLTELSFTEFTGRMANPERGWYTGTTIGPGDKALSATVFKTWRKLGKTLTLVEVELDSYVKSDIPDDFLQLIQKGFDAIREAGLKCVLRFGYSWDYRGDEVSASEKPYDATPEQCLRHIAQLKPLLQRNGDVILCLQAGFIGIWGEWYYTDNFEPSNSAQFTDRRKLVEALLDAMPENRQVQLRTGAYKTKCLGITYADTLSAETAYKTTALARLGFHNDCFLASSDDVGTWSSQEEKKYIVSTSAYTFMGGETCRPSEFSGCENALRQMEAQHWTYLHDGYREEVLAAWSSDGCSGEIGQRLGYRLVLENAYVTEKAAPGSDVRVVLKIRNDGFAAPQNPRISEIVAVGPDGSAAASASTDDPRFWLPGEVHTVDVSFKAPASSGNYEVCLDMPDPAETLRGNPAYSIRLANEDVWDEAKGYNRIYTLTVE